MFSFIFISAAYWLFCLAWFAIVQKPLFGLYNRRSSAEPVTADSTRQIYAHGLLSDAIVASYFTFLPLTGCMICTLAATPVPHAAMTLYNLVIAIVAGLLVTADTALYKFWHFKIEASVMVYLRSIKGATASVSGLYLLTAFCAWAAISATFFFGAEAVSRLCIGHLPMPAEPLAWWQTAATVLSFLTAIFALAITIRGTGRRPYNPGKVYFTNNFFLNHWALNPIYNFIYSFTTKEEFKGRFRFFPQEECDRIVSELFPAGGTPQRRILKNSRPDILLVIWESFGSEYSELLGGRPGITPCTDALARESILFANCTGGSFRTDRGLVNILSGYPAQPTTSIIRYTRKLPNLPGLARTLKAHGYATKAMHGGELSTMHKNDYYLASGHEHLLSQHDYPKTAPAGKWGIHDGYMMQRAVEEAERMHAEGRPFMLTLQTLSSHEPFKVPYSRLSDDIDNSFAYTDHSLGEMVARLKESPVWDNLLLVVVADHGCSASSLLPADRPGYARIPIILGGGAITGPERIDTIMSQTDLAATLLAQMDIDHDEYIFSRDVLAATYTKHFALHVFHNGFMVVDSRGHTIYDTVSGSTVEGDDDERLAIGKAVVQSVYEDLAKR